MTYIALRMEQIEMMRYVQYEGTRSKSGFEFLCEDDGESWDCPTARNVPARQSAKSCTNNAMRLVVTMVRSPGSILRFGRFPMYLY